MSLIKRSPFFRIVSILVILMFFQSEIHTIAGNLKYKNDLKRAIQLYKSGKYDEVINKSEKFLSEIGIEHNEIRGKFFLLLGASYEMSGNKDQAVENYLLGDLILDHPEVEGIDLKKLAIFNHTIFGKIINGQRVFEKVGKRKKKKKFPILAFVGAAAIIAAVFILFNKKEKEDPGDLRNIYAKEVFSEIEWIEIPAGEFLMGDHTGTGEPHERPVHAVYLDSFRISKYEITFSQFDRYDNVNPLDRASFSGRGEKHPVTNVNSYEAILFCKWMTEQNNVQIVLPTEAQWEKAARGTDQRIYPWGNLEPNCDIVNFIDCMAGVSEVGSYPGDRSFYGVFDMGGNVSEWVSDTYQEDYYSISPYENPTGPSEWISDNRILRGGNYASSNCRSTRRQVIIRHSGNSSVGFRVVFK